MDWKDYWNTRPTKYEVTDFYRQVDKTVGGKAVDIAQIQLAVKQIQVGLELYQNDVTLDLCCGNGLITKEVAKLCKSIAAVDYSSHLIDIANEYHKEKNITYILGSALELASSTFPSGPLFDKIYMHDSLQYFNEKDLAQLLAHLKPLSTERCPILFVGVPDQDRIWDFYNTPERRKEYEIRKANGQEAIGTWWEKELIASIAAKEHYCCTFIKQPATTYSAHYRINALLCAA